MRSRARVHGYFFFPVLTIALCTFCLIVSFGCEQNGNGGDHGPGEALDDCGYPVVSVPEGCDGCHGLPPDTARHPPNHRCFRCHGNVIDPDMEWVRPELHRNGIVESSVGCTSCHGWSLGISPPQDLTGSCDPKSSNSGAHEAMRRSAVIAHRVNCSNCHTVPIAIWEIGHIDGDNIAEVRFKNLATARGAEPTWDGNRCSNVYCHGATLKGGWLTDPEWKDMSGRPSQCGACHWLLSPDGDPTADCSSCHPTSVAENRQILQMGTHMNGIIDMSTEE